MSENAAWSEFIRRSHLHVRLLLAGGGVPLADIDREAASVYRAYRRTENEKPTHISPEKWLRGIIRRRLKRRAEQLSGAEQQLANILPVKMPAAWSAPPLKPSKNARHEPRSPFATQTPGAG